MSETTGTSPVSCAVGESRLTRFLRAIFRGGEAADLFVVLRNHEELPGRLAGTDLDVCPLADRSPGEVVSFLERRARECGWEPVGLSSRSHMTGVSFVDTTDTSAVMALHFDIFDGITAMGVLLVPKRLLEAESSVKEGVRILSSRARVLVTTLHHLAWSGGWKKEKYSQELRDVAEKEEDRQWLLEHIESVLGRSFASAVIEGVSRGELTPSFRRRIAVLRAALGIRSGADLSGTVTSILRYGSGQIPSLLHPGGWIGRPGDRVPSLPTVRHDLAVACGVSQHGYSVPTMRSSSLELRTLNGERYLANHRHRWSRLALFRWICPTAFLWLEAKRSRVVVVGRLPLVLRMLRASRLRPRWVAIPP